MNESYTTELLRYNPPFPFSFVIKVREKPVEIMKPDILRLFSYKLDVIENACMDEKHLFRNEMIKNAVLMFFMDISNIHIQQEEKEKVTNKTERKKELFIQFMKLVSVYATKEHSVEFYASKLCITRQYLNRITQLNFRKTAYELISLVLTGELQNVLRHPTIAYCKYRNILISPTKRLSRSFTSTKPDIPRQHTRKNSW